MIVHHGNLSLLIMQYINDTPLKTNHVPWNSMVFHMYSLLKSSLWKRASFHLSFAEGFFPAQLPRHMVHQLLDKGHLGNQKEEFQQSWFWGVKNWWEKKKTQVLKEKSLEDWWFVSSFCKEFGRNFHEGLFFLGWAAWGSLKMESRKASTWGFQRSLVVATPLLRLPADDAKEEWQVEWQELRHLRNKWFWSLKTILLENFSHWVIPDHANKHGGKKQKKTPPQSFLNLNFCSWSTMFFLQ